MARKAKKVAGQRRKNATGESRSRAPEVRPELRQRRRATAWRLLRWAVLGLVLAGLIPVVLSGVYFFKPVHPVSTLMLARWATLQPVDRRWVNIEDVAPVLVFSVLMSEDGQFCAHHGVDWNELNAVISNALEGEPTRGASTIPMQTVKNLFLWTDRSYVRKVVEIPLAVYFDLLLKKKRIMEIYLNIAQWGDGIFGIEAAAQHYFDKPAARLTAREAALLAVTLPGPELRDPAHPSSGLRKLAQTIERRAARSGGYVGCVR